MLQRCISAIIGALASASALAQGPPPAAVVVDAVRREPIELWRQVTGELRSLQRSSLAAEEPGVVLTLAVEEGDRIEQGEVIARLDTTLAEIAIEAQEAEVQAQHAVIRQIEVELAQARRDEQRIRDLTDRAASNETELDRARTAVLRLEAQLARARANLRAAEVRLTDARQRVSDMTITAPFTGHITRKSTEVGQWLGRGDEVVELTSLERIEARLDVPEKLIARLREGSTQVRVIIDAIRVEDEQGRKVPHETLATISRIIPSADPLTRQFTVRVPIPNPEALARPGMSVIAFVPEGRFEPRMTIPRDAVLRDDAGEFVYFDAGGVAMPARIQTRFVTQDRVVIAPGTLQEGMLVVVEGNERLFPSQPLNIVRNLADECSKASGQD